MDPQTLENLMNYQPIIYTIMGGLGGILLGASVGYFFGGRSFDKKFKLSGIEKEKTLSIEQTKRAEIELEKIKAQNLVELEKLKYEHADNEHKRKLEIVAKEREYNLDDEERTYKRRLELTDKITELKPVLEKYVNDLKGPVSYDDENTKKREEFRHQLVEECLQYFRDNDGIAYQIISEESDVIDEDAAKRIEDIVNANYPLKNPISIPTEIKELIDIIKG